MRVLKRVGLLLGMAALLVPWVEAAPRVKHNNKKFNYRYKKPKYKYKAPKIKGVKTHRH